MTIIVTYQYYCDYCRALIEPTDSYTTRPGWAIPQPRYTPSVNNHHVCLTCGAAAFKGVEDYLAEQDKS